MIFRIETVFDSYYYTQGETYPEIVQALLQAELPLIEMQKDSPDCVYVYTEIKDLDSLNRLVEAFGCHIVYGDKTEDGVIIIEKYDTYRE